MRIRYVYDLLKEVEIESDFIPLVGDCVSLMGLSVVPNDVQVASMQVMSRTFSCLSNTVVIYLRKVEISH